MNIRRFVTILAAFIISACSPSTPLIQPTPVPPTVAATVPTVTPETSAGNTATAEPVQNNASGQTVLSFTFPFEPSPPGYIVNIQSTVFSADLMCAVDNGEVLSFDPGADASKTFGRCDTHSMTLDVLIPDQLTVTVILGGFPVVDQVTKAPDTLTDQQAEYHFEATLK